MRPIESFEFVKLEAHTINDNAGWCWYQDDRVLVDHDASTILCATVANLAGVDGETRNGDINVTAYQLSDGTSSTFTLSKILTCDRGDDHNGAALWLRPDGRYLAMYTGHNYGDGTNHGPEHVDQFPRSFYRISTLPHDATAWEPEQVFTWPSNDPVGQGCNHVTYSNLLYLADEGGERGRLYNIARAAGQVMHIATSDDWGETWTYRGVLSLPPTGGRAYSNGYFKFMSNGIDRIDFVATEAHPRNYNTGIYHGYIQRGCTYNSSGVEVDPATFSLQAPPPEAFSEIFKPHPVAEGFTHHAWTTEIKHVDGSGLHVLFTARCGISQRSDRFLRGGPGDADHRLFYARCARGSWSVEELAHMGEGLHPAEEDYTGLGTIDHTTAERVFVSTPIDPRDNQRLKHHEIFVAHRDKPSKTWRWQMLTKQSEYDNLRPQLAVFDSDHFYLLWLRGIYDHQVEYKQSLMVMRV